MFGTLREPRSKMGRYVESVVPLPGGAGAAGGVCCMGAGAPAGKRPGLRTVRIGGVGLAHTRSTVNEATEGFILITCFGDLSTC